MTDFRKKFETYSHVELLNILDNPGDYQPGALEAAKAVMALRQLSDEEICLARSEMAAIRREQEEKDLREKDLKAHVKTLGASLLSAIAPLQARDHRTDTRINFVSIVLGALFLFELYVKREFVFFLFAEEGGRWDFSVPLELFPLFIALPAALLFFRRKKSGWTLSALLLTFMALGAVAGLISALRLQNAGFLASDSVFSPESPAVPLLSLTFWAGILWTICTENLRAAYGVDKNHMLKTLGFCGALLALAMSRLFL